jgi:hypothetical protein
MRNKTGRAKPVTPKAGVTKTSRRYACGGKLELYVADFRNLKVRQYEEE